MNFYEYLKKYKMRGFLIALIIIPFIINFIFVLTDWIAGKGFNYLAIIYSPVLNEEWLSFLGNLIVALATMSVLLYYKEQLDFERKKFIADRKINTLSNEKKVIYEIMKTFDKIDLSSFISEEISCNLVKNKTNEYIRILNGIQLKLDFLTDYRKNDIEEEKEEPELEQNRRHKKEAREKIFLYRDIMNLLLQIDERNILESLKLSDYYQNKDMNRLNEKYLILSNKKIVDKMQEELKEKINKIENYNWELREEAKKVIKDIEEKLKIKNIQRNDIIELQKVLFNCILDSTLPYYEVKEKYILKEKLK